MLTAKHCIQSPGDSAPQPAGNISIGVGTQVGFNTDMRWFRATEIVTTPGVYTQSATTGVQGLDGDDVAVVTLQRSPGVATIMPLLTSPEEYEGADATAVGFGQTPRGQTGTKFRTGTTIEQISDQYLVVEATVCQGDSGGPLISQDNKILGVVSVGTGTCGGGISFYNRIDMYEDMIRGAIEKSAVCSDDGVEACDGFDNDCDDEIDEDCLDIGEDCDDDAECVTRLCARTEAGEICTAECDPLRPLAGCPEGMFCSRTEACRGVCVPGTVGNKAFGEGCEQNSDCRSLFCSDPGDGNKRCLTACRGDGDLCLAGEACVAATDQCGSCVEDRLISDSSRLGVGERCDSNDRCRSGLCVTDGDVKYCAKPCTEEAECEDLGHCRDGACIRGDRQEVGGPCVEAEDCAAGLFCLDDPQRGSYCSQTCEDDAECGEGYACTEVTGGSTCLPEKSAPGGRCTGDGDCITELCHTPSGTCTRLCDNNNACWAGTECVRQGGSAGGVCLTPEAATMGDLEIEPPTAPGGDGGNNADGGDGSGEVAAGGGSSDSGCSASGPVGSGPLGLGWLVAGLGLALWRRRQQ